MKNNQEKKYPTSLFVIGFFMNLTKNLILFFPGVILLIIGIWVKWCLILGIALLLIDVIVSLIEQIQIRNATVNSDNPDFKEWQDAILSSDWKDNIKDLTESKINDSSDNESDA